MPLKSMYFGVHKVTIAEIENRCPELDYIKFNLLYNNVFTYNIYI